MGDQWRLRLRLEVPLRRGWAPLADDRVAGIVQSCLTAQTVDEGLELRAPLEVKFPTSQENVSAHALTKSVEHPLKEELGAVASLPVEGSCNLEFTKHYLSTTHLPPARTSVSTYRMSLLSIAWR